MLILQRAIYLFNRRGFCRAEPERFAFKLSVILREFFDLDKLVNGDAGEMLVRVACGPPYFEILNFCGFAQANMLLQG